MQGNYRNLRLGRRRVAGRYNKDTRWDDSEVSFHPGKGKGKGSLGALTNLVKRA